MVTLVTPGQVISQLLMVVWLSPRQPLRHSWHSDSQINSRIIWEPKPGGFQHIVSVRRRRIINNNMIFIFISQTISSLIFSPVIYQFVNSHLLGSVRLVLNFFQIWKTMKANRRACTSRCSIWKNIKSWPATSKYGRHVFNTAMVDRFPAGDSRNWKTDKRGIRNNSQVDWEHRTAQPHYITWHWLPSHFSSIIFSSFPSWDIKINTTLRPLRSLSSFVLVKVVVGEASSWNSQTV